MEKKNFKLPDKLRKELRKPFPKEAIRAVPGGAKLTSVKSMYVIERLNDVFGLCGWELVYEVAHQDEEEVVVHGCITIPEYGLSTPMQYGGEARRIKTYTKSWENTYKGAVTSLIGKCASFLEVGIDVFKGLVEAPQNGHQKPPAQPAPQAQIPQALKQPKKPKLREMPEDKLTPDLLRKSWDKKFVDGHGDLAVIELTGKRGGKTQWLLAEDQKEFCELFLLSEPSKNPEDVKA